MSGSEARLVQYRVVADHRLHFGKLYFQVIGTNLTLVTVAAIAIGIGQPTWWTPLRLLAALVLVGTGLVAHRLHQQEELYASVMRAIEKQEGDMVQLSDSRRHGARQSVVIVLVATGLLLAIEAARHMVWS